VRFIEDALKELLEAETGAAPWRSRLRHLEIDAHPPLHLRTADHFELDNISPVQVCVSSGTDTPGWGSHGCPACRRGLARSGQAEVIEPVIEGRSTIRHAVDRTPSAAHGPQMIPPGRRTRGVSALVSNLHQLDGRDLFVALILIAGEFRSDPYLKPQGAIKSNP
jgi:hypothetical protein